MLKTWTSGLNFRFYIAGSPTYMAPEVFQSGEYSMASDLWSLGCVLFEMFTGNRLPVHSYLTLNRPNYDKTCIERHPFIPARKRSLRRLCFYRCVSVHRGDGEPPRDGDPPGWRTPPGWRLPSLGQCAGGTHPTRMHSCFHF